MNQQIKSFLVECGAELVRDTHNGQSGTAVVLPKNGLFDFEKFAELIIRECVGILEPKSRYMGEGPEVLKDKIRQIKQHFGVEE